MEVNIKGTAKEIADLVRAIQGSEDAAIQDDESAAIQEILYKWLSWKDKELRMEVRPTRKKTAHTFKCGAVQG